MNREKLLAFVADKHKEQVRKYTGEPYLNHLINVANMSSKTSAPYGYEVGLCHDLFEDTDCGEQELTLSLLELGYGVIATHFIVLNVKELTDEFIVDYYPQLNRAKRKKLEAERLFNISPDAQTVKYCDLIDNTSSIVQYDKGFAVKYLEEKQYILSKMNRGDANMYSKALDTLFEAKDKLGLTLSTR